MEGGRDYRRKLGDTGEGIACRILEEMGHVILERNWRSGHLEIDIISLDNEGIHFVEVKTRCRNVQAPPQENVNKIKQQRITRAAKHYLNGSKGRHLGNHECMFDVIAITFEGGEPKAEWIPQAFIPLYI